MNRTVIGLVSLLAILPCCRPAQGGQLVSIKDVAPKQGAYIWSFDIEIKHAKVLAICRILDGWKITATNYAETGLYKDGGAHIAGEASVGHVALDQRGVGQLLNLFLIEAEPSKAPLEFSGSLRIEGYNEAESESGTRKIAPSSYVIADAKQCP